MKLLFLNGKKYVKVFSQLLCWASSSGGVNQHIFIRVNGAMPVYTCVESSCGACACVCFERKLLILRRFVYVGNDFLFSWSLLEMSAEHSRFGFAA